MPISKPDFNLIFASQAPSQDLPAAFNNYARGWDESRKNNGKPTIKQFNYVIQQLDLKALWMIQNGTALPFDETVDYAEGALTLKDGELQQFISGVWVGFLDDFADKDEVKRGIANRYDHSLTYNSGDRVVLTNGDIVKSTADGNTNDPNTDMTGWINISNVMEVESISDLLSIPSPQHGQLVFAHHYDLEQGLLDGGGSFVYQNSNQSVNDGGYIFNGWTRQLERPIFTPEMFGAKGDLSKDDAPNIRSCVQSARINKIKCIQFHNKYLIDSARITGQETLLEIIPDCSFLGFGNSELVVGDSIPDKFHILAAVNYIITTTNVGNVLIDGIKFRALSSATNMSSYTSNIAIHTFGLNNVCIQRCTFDDLDLANVIVSGIRYNGVDYGSKVTIQNNKILSVVAENPINIDHSSIYMEAPDSFILNNLFKSKTLQCRKVSCGVEIHNSGILVHDNYLEGYSRFVWFAAQPNNVINSHAYNNTAKVSNHFAIITSASNEFIARCSVHNNYVRCEHATSEPNFITYQGLAVTSGLLFDGWQYVEEFDIYDNELHIDYSFNADFATIVNFDQDVSSRIFNNSCHGAVAGVNAKDLTNGGGFVGNKIYNHIKGSAKNKDFFINITNASSNSMSVCDNEFWFKANTRPNYLVGFPNITGDNLVLCSISGNKYRTIHTPQVDVYFQLGLNIGGNGNTLDINVFNATVNIPALTAGQEHSWMQALPNNFNNCIIDLGIIAESKFYPLYSRAVAVGTNVPVRVKALETSASFSVSVPSVNIKTR